MLACGATVIGNKPFLRLLCYCDELGSLQGAALMSHHTSQPASHPTDEPDEDDEWYEESWAPVVDLIEDGEWPSNEELARRLSNGWLIPKIVREVIADRIQRKDLRSRGRPTRAMPLKLVWARIAFAHLRHRISAARKNPQRTDSDLIRKFEKEPGTPKELALEEIADRYEMNPETLRYWFYSAPERGRHVSKADLSTEPPSPPVDWETVRFLIQTRDRAYRTRVTPATRTSLADAVRRDPDPPEEILQFVRTLLRR
jgi:hypothetical protein